MDEHLPQIIHSFLRSLQRQIVKQIKDFIFGAGFENEIPTLGSAIASILWCLHAALAIGDETGQYYAMSILSTYLLPRCEVEDMDVMNLFLIWMYNQIGCEDNPVAWAALHVGDYIKHNIEHSIEAVNWIKKSLDLAKTDRLKYVAIQMLYDVSISRGNNVLAISQERLMISTKLGDQCAIASSFLSCLLAYRTHGDLEGLQNIQEEMNKFPDNEVLHYARLVSDVALLSTEGKMDECIKQSTEVIKHLESISYNMDEHIDAYLKSEATKSSFSRIVLIRSCIRVAGVLRLEALRLRYENPGKKDDELASNFLNDPLYNALEGNREKLALILELDKMLLKGEYEKAEKHAAELLFLSQEPFHAFFHSWAFFYLALVIKQYAGEALQAEGEKIMLEIMDDFFLQAEKGVFGVRLLRFKVAHGNALYIRGQYKRAKSKLLESIELYLELEPQLTLGSGRINYLEDVQPSFVLLERICCREGDGGMALIWNERGRCRDLTYHISKDILGESFLKELHDFDSSKDWALEEIRNVRELGGVGTVFLVYSWIPGHFMVAHFLHLGSKPMCYFVEDAEVKAALPHGHGSLSFTNEPLKKLFCILIKPWKKYLNMFSKVLLPNKLKLIIAPSQELSRIPFAALYDSESSQYLVQTYAVATVPSLRLFRHCEKMRYLKTEQFVATNPKTKRSALVVGNPETRRLPNLVAAEAEADDVALHLFNTATYHTHILKEREATLEKVKKLLPDCDWVHIAAHGVVNRQYPRGAIILASSKPSASKLQHSTAKPKPREAVDIKEGHIAAHGIVDHKNPHMAITLDHSKASTSDRSTAEFKAFTSGATPWQKEAAKEIERFMDDDSWMMRSRVIDNKDSVADAEGHEEFMDDEECEVVEIDRAGFLTLDGGLSANEIETAKKLKASAVVLSCCETGLGKCSQEGTLGLFRSLHMVGVPTVVCTLWKVNDSATRELMQELYLNLADGNEIVIALQQAMNAMIERGKAIAQWAPFVISGSPSTKLCPTIDDLDSTIGNSEWRLAKALVLAGNTEARG